MSERLKRQWKKFNVKDLKQIIKTEKLGKVSKMRKNELINILIHKEVDISKYKSSRVKREVSEERKTQLKEQLARARELKQQYKRPALEPIKEEEQTVEEQKPVKLKLKKKDT